jgi:cyclopropane fatty-acyl-phospholipid synthase-like methyltransferase
MEVLVQHRGVTGVGVDIALPADAAARATSRGLQDRASWVEADAASWSGGLFDGVLCVGATHAFGGLAGTLAGVRRHLRPGGEVLLGDTIWDVPPSSAALTALQAQPEDFPDLPGLVDTVRAHGFEPGYGHTSTVQEWDDYEWSWTGSLTEWALHEAPTGEAREQAMATAVEHRNAWLRGYRHQLGFATLVLHDTRAA